MISIIVPVYKTEEFLDRCMESILAQSYKDYEVWLVDDGSPDEAGRMCDEYARRHKRINVIHQENKGLSAARNAAIEKVLLNEKSEWITFIDSDDWVHHNFLELLHQAIVDNPTAEVSMCRFKPVFEKEADFVLPDKYDIDMVDPETAYLAPTRDAIDSYAWGRLYSKHFFEKIRYPEGRCWEDMAVTWKILFNAKAIVEVKLPLLYYYQNPLGIVRRTWNPSHMDNFLMRKEQIGWFKKNGHDEMFHVAASCYVKTIYENYYQIKAAKVKDKERYLDRVLKLLRRELINYHKVLPIKKKENRAYYKLAFPQMYKALRKIKRVVK